MTDEFEYLEEAFAARGWDCEVEIDEDEGCARFCVCKGDISAEFEAQASAIWNPLSRNAAIMKVNIDGQTEKYGFGLKRPGSSLFGKAYEDFCLSGFNKAGGDDPHDYSRKISARKIVRALSGMVKPPQAGGG